MEDNVVTPSSAIFELEEECEPFQSTEGSDLRTDFIPDTDESSDSSDSDDDDDEDSCNEVIENTWDANDEYSLTEKSSTPLAQPEAVACARAKKIYSLISHRIRNEQLNFRIMKMLKLI